MRGDRQCEPDCERDLEWEPYDLGEKRSRPHVDAEHDRPDQREAEPLAAKLRPYRTPTQAEIGAIAPPKDSSLSRALYFDRLHLFTRWHGAEG